VIELKNIKNTVNENVSSVKLDNGLTIILVKKDGFSSYFAELAVNYGGSVLNYKIDDKNFSIPEGTAHFLEHQLFTNEDGPCEEAFSEMGASPNAFTSPSMTAYHFECSRNFYENLATLINFVSKPYFTAESVEKERGIIAQEISMSKNRPSYRLYRNFLNSLFERHEISSAVLGTVESISEVDAELLYRVHSHFYIPSNMLLTVCGDVEIENVIETVETAKLSAKGHIPEPVYSVEESIRPFRRETYETADIAATQLLFGCKFKDLSPDEAHLFEYASFLGLNAVFGPTSGFFYENYNAGLFRGSFALSLDTGILSAPYLTFSCESQKPEELLANFTKELERVKLKGVKEEDFRRCLNALFGRELRSLDSFYDLSYALSSDFFKGLNYLESFELFNKINVSDINNFLRLIEPEHLCVAQLNPKE
jgi:predicted Zn-dependent peptidase